MEPLQKQKISLMSHGVQVTPAATVALAGDENKPLSVGDYVTTSGLTIILPGNIYVNANFKEEFCKRSENILDFQDRLLIRSPYGQWPVSCLPVPTYYNKRLTSGRPVTQVIMTHADRMRISPIRGCSNHCQFCDMGTAFHYQKVHTPELCEALDIALHDQGIIPKHLLISGGTPKKEDESYLDSVYQTIIKKSPVPVDVMMTPRDDETILEQLLEWGCRGLSINLEIYDDKVAKKIMPEKHRLGKEKYLDFIQKAVNLFGKGAVRSSLILGLETPESTLEGVKCLAQTGCDPMLSTFKPLQGTSLNETPPPSPEFQAEVYEEAEKIVRRYHVLLGPRCIPCQHNTLTYPIPGENYFFY